MTTIKYICTSVEICGQARPSTWEVLMSGGKPYFVPVQSRFVPELDGSDLIVEHRMFFEPSETQPDPSGRPEYRVHPKVWTISDSTPVKI